MVLTRERGYVKTREKAIGISAKLYKKYPKIVEGLETRADRYNQCMQELQKLEKEGKVFVIAPDTTYGVGRTEKDVAKMKKLYQEGYEIAKRNMDALKKYINQ